MNEKVFKRTVIEADLVDSMKNECPIGFKTFYQNYAESLLGVICRIIPDSHLAEDILQDTMVNIWKNIHKYDPAKGKLFTWALTLTQNLAIDKLRSKGYNENKRINKLHDIFDSSVDIRWIIINTDIIGLRKITAILPRKLFNVIDMVFFKGYTHLDTAKELDIPLGTVKSRIRRAVAELRKVFDYRPTVDKSLLGSRIILTKFEKPQSKCNDLHHIIENNSPVTDWRTIVNVIYYNDFTYSEISKKLNIKLSDAKKMRNMPLSILKKLYMH